jgi:DinB superfamily
LLASWEIPFEAIDVEARPAARAELARLGVPGPPATVRGDRVVHGWNPKALAALVGIAYDEGERLAPAELARRLDRVLVVAASAMRQIPPEHLTLAHPGRDRSIRQLGYHVFRLALASRDAMEGGRLPKAWQDEAVPPEVSDGPAVAAYGETVRRRLADWFARPGAWDGVVETWYGPQSGHDLLERTAWHAAQHVRQIHDLLGRVGVTPDVPLTESDLRGLPLPLELW